MGVEIKKITDPAFRAYGKVVDGYRLSELLTEMKKTPLPQGVEYVPSVPELEGLKVSGELAAGVYGGMPIQVGYCNGHNQKLNAVEYHRDAELDIAVDDLVLLLGKEQDIRPDHTYETSRMEAFLVPAGTAVLLYETTLHYAPCQAGEEGFRCVIILPRGTNEDMAPLEEKNPEDRLLFARNKWLIGHPEGGLTERAFIGLVGENLSVGGMEK